MHRSAIGQYRQEARVGSVQDASPHKLILILFDSAIEKMVTARGALERGDIAEKARCLSTAIRVVEGLWAVTDPQAGGDLASNLRALYGYCLAELLGANLRNDLTKLSEVVDVLRLLRSAWAEIPPAYHFHAPSVVAAGPR